MERGSLGRILSRWALSQTQDHIVIIDKLTYAGHYVSIQDLLVGNQYDIYPRRYCSNPSAMEKVFHDYRPQAIVSILQLNLTLIDPLIAPSRLFRLTLWERLCYCSRSARKFIDSLPTGSRSEFRFLHVSTDEVYGTLEETGQFSEDTPYAPNSPYAASKAGADHLVRAYCETYGIPTLITNCSNNYGPYQFPEKLVPLMLLNAVEGKKLPIYGNGQHVRDWLYVEDHCEGLWAVLRRRKTRVKNIILVEIRNSRICETVEMICQLLEEIRPSAEQ